MDLSTMEISGKQCRIYRCGPPDFLLIQPSDTHGLSGLDTELGAVRSKADKGFIFAAFEVNDWNSELSPWSAPAAFGKKDFGSGAADTLDWVTEQLIPQLSAEHFPGKEPPVIIGGYSLAGLFALWSAYTSNRFAAAAGVSPSEWFPGWAEFTGSRTPEARSIYLSLGKKEEKVRSRTMSAVGGNIRRHFSQLQAAGISSVLEWNEGGHFSEPELRTARGFAWCISALQQKGAEND